jgi:hypothetical protein
MVLAGAPRVAHIQGIGRFPAASGCFRSLAGVRHLEAGVAQRSVDLDRMQDDAQLLGPSNGRDLDQMGEEDAARLPVVARSAFTRR